MLLSEGYVTKTRYECLTLPIYGDSESPNPRISVHLAEEANQVKISSRFLLINTKYLKHSHGHNLLLND